MTSVGAGKHDYSSSQRFQCRKHDTKTNWLSEKKWRKSCCCCCWRWATSDRRLSNTQSARIYENKKKNNIWQIVNDLAEYLRISQKIWSQNRTKLRNMKLLENAALDGLSSILTMETPICDMTTRFDFVLIKIKGKHLGFVCFCLGLKVIHVKWQETRKNCTNNCATNMELLHTI